jgi:hypothetical protein
MDVLSDWSYGREMPRVVYNMAPAHPEKAFELAETVEQPVPRARSFAYMALALRETDADRALQALERAIALMANVSPGSGPGMESREAPVIAAEIAYVAARIGYPAVDRLVWRAIAMRPAPSNEPWARDGSTGFLKPLAFVRPELTAQLVRDSVERKPMAEYEGYSRDADDLMLAAAATNAHLAAEMVRSVPPADEDNGFPRIAQHRITVVRNLLIPADQRLTRHYVDVMGQYGNWVPGADAD